MEFPVAVVAEYPIARGKALGLQPSVEMNAAFDSQFMPVLHPTTVNMIESQDIEIRLIATQTANISLTVMSKGL